MKRYLKRRISQRTVHRCDSKTCGWNLKKWNLGHGKNPGRKRKGRNYQAKQNAPKIWEFQTRDSAGLSRLLRVSCSSGFQIFYRHAIPGQAKPTLQKLWARSPLEMPFASQWNPEPGNPERCIKDKHKEASAGREPQDACRLSVQLIRLQREKFGSIKKLGKEPLELGFHSRPKGLTCLTFQLYSCRTHSPTANRTHLISCSRHLGSRNNLRCAIISSPWFRMNSKR